MAVREVVGPNPHPEASSIIPVPVPEFGNTSYLVVSGDEALAIDPPRDISRLRTLAHRRGARIRLVVETHVHNDYLSGALAMRRATGAEIAVPARGGYRFEHRSLDDGDELRIGDLRLVAIATPGHTPEHLAYLVHRDDHGAPEAVFSGGSLLVGTAGRSDLLGPDHADELDRAQYRSIHRLASLPADITLFPTHGAGSSCSVDPAIDRRARSTIGEERTDNPALTAPDVEAFLSGRRSIHLPIPSYFSTMAERNRDGVPALDDEFPPALGPEEVARILTGGGWVIDAREPYAFAAASIPGSVWIPPDSLFATHVGSVVPAGVRFALVLDHPELEQLQQVLTPLGSIGYTPVEGFLSGGVGAWRASGRPVRTLPTSEAAALAERRLGGDPLVIDVRDPSEWEDEQLEGTLRIPLADLVARLGEIPRDRPVWTACTGGRRGTIAATVLRRAGIDASAVTDGGVGDLRLDAGPTI